MFKFFKSKKEEKVLESTGLEMEKKPDFNENQMGLEDPGDNKLDSSDVRLDFTENIASLKEAMEIQKELGGHLKLNDIFNIVGARPEELLEFLKGQEISLEAKGNELISEIEIALETYEKEQAENRKKGVMETLANNQIVRAAFVALMLFAKFNQAQAAENKDQNRATDKMEHVSQKAVLGGPDPDKIYSASAHDFIDETPRLITLDMENYFDTDSDQIKDPGKIIADFENFLSRITPDNAAKIIASDFIIYGSSDERPTSNWNGSNEELTNARLNALEKVLGNTLKNFNFSLPDDLANQLKAKTFIHEMPESDSGPEKGVTYITDLDNQETGEKYTAAEIKNIKINDPVKYQSLLDDCRKVTFYAALEKTDKIHNLEPKSLVDTEDLIDLEKRPIEIKFSNLGEYDNVNLIFDNSPSQSNSYDYMADIVAGQDLKNAKVNFGTFSDDLDNLKEAHDAHEISQEIKGLKFDGNSSEKALDAASKALKKMPDKQNNALFIMTDEPFQKITLEKLTELKNLAGEKTAEVYFYYGDDQTKTVRQISLVELEDNFKQSLLDKIEAKVNSKISSEEKKIKTLEVQKELKDTKLKMLAERDLSPAQKKSFTTEKNKVTELASQIQETQNKLNLLRNLWLQEDLAGLMHHEWLEGSGISGQAFNESIVLNVEPDNLGEVAFKFGEK